MVIVQRVRCQVGMLWLAGMMQRLLARQVFVGDGMSSLDHEITPLRSVVLGCWCSIVHCSADGVTVGLRKPMIGCIQ